MTANPLLRLICGLFVLLVLAMLATAPGAAVGNDGRESPTRGSTESTLEARVGELIRQLGDEQYAVRQRAQEQIRSLGVVAFDSLLAACRHEDVEIALRARYLIRDMPVEWMRETDPPAVKSILRNYDHANQAERRNRMQQLARLEESRGLSAVCRLMRFESSGLLSKQAALSAMHHTPSTDSEKRAALAETIRTNVGRSTRPASIWLRAYAQTLVAPELALPEWDRIARAELMTFAQFPQQTDRRLVRELLRWQVDLLRRLERNEESLAVIRRTIDLLVGEREELFDFVDWLLDRDAWSVVDEVANRFHSEFHRHPRLIYRLAEARRLRGELELADQTAQDALQMEPGQPHHHNLMASYLTERLLYDWAEDEYRSVLKSTDQQNGSHIEARFFLSDMLFDIQRELDAANVLQIAAETIEQHPKVLNQLPFPRRLNQVRGAVHYYYAMHHSRHGQRDEQIDRLRQAVAADPSNPDFVIAMYRIPDAEAAWLADVLQRINTAKERLHQDIQRSEQALSTPPKPADLEHLAKSYNELAWLISNTEGDFQAAVRYSRKALEFRPNNPAYLDTLGRCYYAAGDIENAVKYQSRAAELAPFYQQIRRQLEIFQKELAESKPQISSEAEKPKKST